MTIVAFLEDRLNEAEARGRTEPIGTPGVHLVLDGLGTSFRELELARVAAMRQAVAQHQRDRFSRICLTCRPVDPVDGWASEAWPCPTICHLAALWADHPAYDRTWAPRRATVTGAGPAPPRRRTSNGAWLSDAHQP